MLKKFTKIISFCIIFSLIVEQTGFAQVAGQLDVSSRVSTGLSNALVQDKFRPLHLRYMSYNPQINNFQLLLDKGSLKNQSNQEIESTSQELFRYFLIGITLPDDAFWVNLRPDAVNNIMDESLAKTDLGKILLEADLQLKKDTARYTSPQTAEGKDYWNKLYQKAQELYGSENVTIPTLNRPWIVPSEIIIRESQESAYIYKATLKVMLEEDYLKNSQLYNFKDQNSRILNEYSSKLLRETIIPKITKEINSSKRYAKLRQVYYSLILAQWFKNKYSSSKNIKSKINSNDLTSLISKEAWSKDVYYQAYQKSFKEGEYNIKEPRYRANSQVIRSYVSGGIVFKLFETIKLGLVNSPIELGKGLINKCYSVLAFENGRIEVGPKKNSNQLEDGGTDPIEKFLKGKDAGRVLADIDFKAMINRHKDAFYTHNVIVFERNNDENKAVLILSQDIKKEFNLTLKSLVAAKVFKNEKEAKNFLDNLSNQFDYNSIYMYRTIQLLIELGIFNRDNKAEIYLILSNLASPSVFFNNGKKEVIIAERPYRLYPKTANLFIQNRFEAFNEFIKKAKKENFNPIFLDEEILLAITDRKDLVEILNSIPILNKQLNLRVNNENLWQKSISTLLKKGIKEYSKEDSVALKNLILRVTSYSNNAFYTLFNLSSIIEIMQEDESFNFKADFALLNRIGELTPYNCNDVYKLLADLATNKVITKYNIEIVNQLITNIFENPKEAKSNVAINAEFEALVEIVQAGAVTKENINDIVALFNDVSEINYMMGRSVEVLKVYEILVILAKSNKLNKVNIERLNLFLDKLIPINNGSWYTRMYEFMLKAQEKGAVDVMWNLEFIERFLPGGDLCINVPDMGKVDSLGFKILERFVEYGNLRESNLNEVESMLMFIKKNVDNASAYRVRKDDLFVEILKVLEEENIDRKLKSPETFNLIFKFLGLEYKNYQPDNSIAVKKLTNAILIFRKLAKEGLVTKDNLNEFKDLLVAIEGDKNIIEALSLVSFNTKIWTPKLIILATKNLYDKGVYLLRDLENQKIATKENLSQVELFLREYIKVVTGHDADAWKNKKPTTVDNDDWLIDPFAEVNQQDNVLDQGPEAWILLKFLIENNSFSAQDFPVIITLFKLLAARNKPEVFKDLESIFRNTQDGQKELDEKIWEFKLPEILELIDALRIVSVSTELFDRYLKLLDKNVGISMSFLKIIEKESKFLPIVKNYIIYILPKELRQLYKLEDVDIEKEFLKINKDNYLEEPFSIYIYLKIRKDIPFSVGLSYEEFKEILKGDVSVVSKSRYTGLVAAYVAQYVFNEASKLTPKQQKEVIELSIELYKHMLALAKEHSLNDVIITFRELIRFNIDFSRYYLGKSGAKNVIEYFILTSFNIYGRVIKDENLKLKFCNFIKNSLNSYPELFGQAQVSSDILRDGKIENIIEQLVNYGDYENLARTPKSNEVPLMVSISSFIKRATQVARPLLLTLNTQNSFFFIEVLKELMQDKNNVVVTLPANRFTRRQEFFGMYLPKQQLTQREIEDTINTASDELIKQAIKDVLGLDDTQAVEYFDLWQKNDPEIAKDKYLRWAVAAKLKYQDKWKENFAWSEGALVKLVHEALNNPDKNYYFVIENIEACPDRVRVLFNPVLWEKIVEIPEKGTRLALPANLQFIFTKHQDSQIKDAAFMDRFIIQHIKTPSRQDVIMYLLFNLGLSYKDNSELVEIFQDLKKLTLEKEISFGYFDLIEIGKRIKGLAKESNVESLDKAIIAKEVYDYMYLRLATRNDREKLKVLISKDYTLSNPTIEIIGDEIVFDGVRIKATKEFLSYVEENPDKSFAQLVSGFYNGFVVTELEMRVFSQLARALKYGSKVIQLEGPSGEGKTEIGRVFSKIINFDLQETTVNEGTDTAEFIGRILPGQRGYHLALSSYLTKITNGRNLFLINEINTSLEQGICYLLFNEITGLAVRFLTQFPVSAGDESILKMARISQNNLWLFTVNPDNFKGRESTPPIVYGHIPVFYMAQDIEQTPQITEEMFKQKNLDPTLSEKLAQVHMALKNKIKNNDFDSKQDITRRELIRVVERYSLYVKTMSEQEALKKAVFEVYVYMWLQRGDIEKAIKIVTKILGPEENLTTSQDSLEAAIKDNKPVLVITDGTNDKEIIEQNIKSIYPEAEIVSVPVSYFHRERQFLGGLIPRKSKSTRNTELEAIQPKVDNGLGIIAGIIKKARLSSQKMLFVILHNYTHINPKVAPLLNEFLQTGKLPAQEKYVTLDMVNELVKDLKNDILASQSIKEDYQKATGKEIISWESLNEEDLLNFGYWFYSNLPGNVRIIASGSSEEKVYLSQAELDRFLPINVSQGITEDWIMDYLDKQLRVRGLTHKGYEIVNLVIEVFEKYEEQKDAMFYDHNRLGKEDIDAFLNEIMQMKEVTNENLEKLAYYILAAGLRSEFRDKLSFKINKNSNPESLIRYEKRKDGVYIIVDVFEYKTNFKEIPQDEFLASTQNLVTYLASMLLAIKYNRAILLEGNPGGGKTSLSEELAKRLGIKSSKILMYEDIDLGPFLGQMSLQGNKIIMTSDKDASGRYILDFLRAYSEGGIYTLDEGAMGMNSQEVISFLIMLSQMNEINLGMFHPGLENEIIKKHKNSEGKSDFHLVVTQNPARTTRAREPIPYGVDSTGAKVWVDNVLSQEDALRIIDYYLKDKNNVIPKNIKLAIAKIHNNFTRIHPSKEELSPRQLIMVASILKDAMEKNQDLYKAAFMGIMLAYLAGVSEGEFKMLWDEMKEDLNLIDKKIMNKFRKYLASWEEQIVVQTNDTDILFNGITIPKSKEAGNVKQEDVILFENNMSFQNKLLRAMALLVSLHMPIALLEEDGADALDVARKFAYLTGYQLYTFWSHPQMSRMQMLSNVLPKFSKELDKYGIKTQDLSHEFVMGLGFLLRHMVTQEEYEQNKDQAQTQKILFFNFFDAIPERQRVLLNEILTTKKITIQNESGESIAYVLPDWVHIMVSSQVEHKFSSAFINRFIKMRLGFPSSIKDLKAIIQKRYPLIRDQEVDWINMLVNEVSRFDRDSAFGIGYGFSPKDTFNFAMIMQLEKQKDILNKKFNPNPLYYFLKAAYIMYYSALEEYADREKFEKEIVKGVFLNRVLGVNVSSENVEILYADIKAEIEKEMFTLNKSVHSLKVDVSQLSLGKKIVLRNGIIIERLKDAFVISTPANTYTVKDEQLINEVKLSEDLYIQRENGQLIIKLMLTDEVGGKKVFRDKDDKENFDRSLPENEVSEFIRYTNQIRRLVSCFLTSWQRVQDNTGRIKLPRVVFLDGETGTAKTALMRNLASIMGVPIYVLNAYSDLKVSDISVGFKLTKDEVQIGVKDFLIRCGKVNGQRKYLPSQVTSSRTILLIDEANASPEILYALMPLFRGEKKFTVEYAGESFEVEVDDQVMVVLTFNPMEKYAGREGFARSISFFADKLWAPNPQNYEKDVLIDILVELHRRGITSVETEKNKLEQAQAVYEEYIPVKAQTEQVQDLAHPIVLTIADLVLQIRMKKNKVSQKTSEKVTRQTMDTQMRKGLETISDEKPETMGAKINIDHPYNIKPELCRQGVFDEVEELEMVSTGDNEEKVILNLRASVPNNWKTIKANINATVRKNTPTLLTSPVPASMLKIISYKAVNDKQEEIKVRFLRGKNTDSLYIQSESDYQGVINISFEVAIDKSVYFGKTLKGEIDFDMPVEISQVILKVLNNTDLGYNKDNYFNNKKEFIYALVKFFKNFGVNENGIENKGKGETVLEKIFSSQEGVCRQRAYAFFILTRSLGFKTRYVENQIHAFCEIYVKDYGWVRLDLGGGGDPASMQEQENADMQEVEEAGDLPQADSQEALGFQKKYQERKKEIDLANSEKNNKGAGQSEGSSEGQDQADAKEQVDGEEQVEGEGQTGEQSAGEGQVGGGGGKGSSKGEVLEAGQNVGRNLAKLSAVAPNLVNQFLSIFSGDPKTFLEYSDSGDEMDIEKIIGQDTDPFFIKRVIQDVASLVAGLTLDVSGSVQGELLNNFTNMTAFYTSLFYYAAIKNKNLSFSLSAIGDNYHMLLDGENCRELKAVEESLGSFKDLKDYGGINTVAVIEGIRQKYQKTENKQHKLEIVLTDGSETSGKSFAALRDMLDALEKELNIDIVFIGIQTKDVTNYSKFIELDRNPSTKELIKLIMTISLAKVARQKLPKGDLAKQLGIKFQEEDDGGVKKNILSKSVTSSASDSDGNSATARRGASDSDGEKGGIDFRALPIVTQAISNLSVDIAKFPLNRLENIDLDLKFQELEKMVNVGMTPSAERIKEYVQASCFKDESEQYFDQAVLCISDIMRLEEEKCTVTNRVLKDILLVLESGMPTKELKRVFIGRN